MSSHKSRSSRVHFYVFFRDEKYRIKPEVFCQHSKRFKELYNPGLENVEITEKVSKESVMIFLRMAQNTPYEITYDCASEVLTLTRSWDCPDLEDVATQFCVGNNITVRPKYDPIGILLDAIDNEKESVVELTEVAKVLNESLGDDRLPDIEPEILFRIVLIAEKEVKIDMPKYKDFVLKMFKSNPQTAVILSLRLPFNEMTEEEINIVRNCPEIRIQSINFFFANSLGIVRNMCNKRLRELNEETICMIDQTKREIEFSERELDYELKKYQIEKKEMIEKRLDEQQKEVEEIFDLLLFQANRLDSGSLSEHGLVDPRLSLAISNAYKALGEMQSNIETQLNKNKDQLHVNIQKGIEQRLNIWNKKYGNGEIQLKDINLLLEKAQDIAKSIKEKEAFIDDGLKNVQALVNAKIVRDKLKFDKGRRNTEQKFSIFDDEENSVKEADTLLQQLESKIEGYCPLRASKSKN